MAVQAHPIRLLLAGDVMLARGVDQVLAHPGDPSLFEDAATSALDYVALAERVNGPIPRPLTAKRLWGDALAAMDRYRPDLRIVNLETAVTRRGRPVPKGINYRMTPENLEVLEAFEVDCCVLANNHVLDWGEVGLEDTLDALHDRAFATAGAGRTAREAEAPAVLTPLGRPRVLVVAAGFASSGIPPRWAAGRSRPGVVWFEQPGAEALAHVQRVTEAVRRPGDVVVASLHWGPNWGDAIGDDERTFAHGLVERAGIDVVHGHSSHHVRAIEVHRGRPILYGCGDLVNDYEGIGGHHEFRPDLALLYLVTLDGATRTLTELRLLPFRLRRFCLTTVDAQDLAWLEQRLDRAFGPFGGHAVRHPDGTFTVAAPA